MDWREEGLLIAVRPHGEAAAIIEVLTRARGRHAGLVRGGSGRRLSPILQVGAQLDLTWRARLEEHLGTFTVEPLRGRTAMMSNRLALAGLSAVAAMSSFALAERHPYPALYDAATSLLDQMEAADTWPPAYVAWELHLLADLGFGLDLETCAVTGARDGLAYVSPKSGRAVSIGAASDWADRLLPLPPFLRRDAGDQSITATHVAEGLRLTGHFLAKTLAPALGHSSLPPARDRLLRAVSRR